MKLRTTHRWPKWEQKHFDGRFMATLRIDGDDRRIDITEVNGGEEGEITLAGRDLCDLFAYLHSKGYIEGVI